MSRAPWTGERRLGSFLRGTGTAGAFVSALGRPSTYLPHLNPYVVFGFLWGVPVPVASIGVHMAAIGAPWTLEAAVEIVRSNPFHLVFMLHPIVFAVVFGAVGTVVREREERIAVLIADLKTKADTDGLTGLYNHRTFQSKIRDLAETSTTLSLLLLDVDHFKRFNDRYGHPRGDELLRALAGRISNAIRSNDVACRYGGEEFAVLVPGLDADGAARIAERIRAHVVEAPFRLEGVPDGVRVTLSGGVTCRAPDEHVGDWISRTDGLLYQAKRDGRDRVCLER